MTENADLTTLVQHQHGAFRRDQAIAAGIHRSTVDRRCTSGRWRRAAPGVLVLSGSPPTQAQRWWVIALSLGDRAVLSHESAGRRHLLPGIAPHAEAVILPQHDHRRRAGVTIHQQRLEQRDVEVLDGLPFTSLPRTLCDLASTMSVARLRAVVDAAQFDLRLPIVQLAATFARLGMVGRPGATGMGAILDERIGGTDLADSRLEVALAHVLGLAGIGDGIAQHPLPSCGGLSGLVDRAFPEVKLITEADGRTWHARQGAIHTDRARDLEAAAEGWMTIRLTHEQLVGDPVDTARAIAKAYRSRLPG